MAKLISLFPLDDFARSFIADKEHFEDIRTEDLAERFRAWFDLPAFPNLVDLRQVCIDLGVKVAKLPMLQHGLPGANMWSRDGGHEIFLDPSLSVAYAETTLGHELREVLEIAFRRVKPAYVGLDTHNNREMHARSERFAGALLMQTAESRVLFARLGYDFKAFSYATGRSLSSVIRRSQELFAARHGQGVVGAVWLFDLPWSRELPEFVALKDLRVIHRAHLCGFSMQKSRRGDPVHLAFPTMRSSARDYDVTRSAFGRRVPVLTEVVGFDLFGDRDFVVAAEPIVTQGGMPWRILMTAVRRDFMPNVQPWIDRLGVPFERPAYQTA